MIRTQKGLPYHKVPEASGKYTAPEPRWMVRSSEMAVPT